VSERTYDVGPGFVRAKECPDCGHTRCGNASRIDSADALSCACNCDAARAEEEADVLRDKLGEVGLRLGEVQLRYEAAQRENDALRAKVAEARVRDLEAALGRPCCQHRWHSAALSSRQDAARGHPCGNCDMCLEGQGKHCHDWRDAAPAKPEVPVADAVWTPSAKDAAPEPAKCEHDCDYCRDCDCHPRAAKKEGETT
jgi:hypothetical protein